IWTGIWLVRGDACGRCGAVPAAGGHPWTRPVNRTVPPTKDEFLPAAADRFGPVARRRWVPRERAGWPVARRQVGPGAAAPCAARGFLPAPMASTIMTLPTIPKPKLS